MATKKVKRGPRVYALGLTKTIPTIPKGATLVLDKQIFEVLGGFGVSVEQKHPKEFALIDNMAIKQSAVFPTNKKTMIDAIRSRLHRLTDKRYVVRKINPEVYRIWRMPDKAIIRKGGRVKGYAQKTSWSRVKKEYQNPDGTKKKSNWGGKRVAGQKAETTTAEINNNNK